MPANQTPLKLYQIYNTSHRSLLVLASDARNATDTAYAANHLHYMWQRKDRSYPNVSEVKAPYDDKLAACWKAIEVAISKRLTGVVHLDDGYIRVGGEKVGC
jgi:hypothetical protein